MNKKASTGFTLLEATIALAIWMILSISVIFIWQHVSTRTDTLMERQNAFENARISMDGLIMNIQMSHTIELWVEGDYILQRLRATGYNPDGVLHPYNFHFDTHASPGLPRHHVLRFGLHNEFASNIAMVRIQPEPVHERYLNIIIRTGCRYPVVLEGNVDIRYKTLIVHRAWQ